MQDRDARKILPVDPITLEVIWHGLISIANQIDANIKRTAFSPYIYEYNDFAVALLDADGQLIAQCTGGMPPFVADSVGAAVRDGLEVYGADRLGHGDVVLCNHRTTPSKAPAGCCRARAAETEAGGRKLFQLANNPRRRARIQ